MYVGRPKNDGGWYLSPSVKAGSMFANPYSLKEYELSESLSLFRELVNARASDLATTTSVIELLPEPQRRLAEARFAGGLEKPAVGKSVAHLELGCVGKAFRNKLRELRGLKLGCFCSESDPCHAKVLCEIARAEDEHEDEVEDAHDASEVCVEAESSKRKRVNGDEDEERV